MPKFKNPLGIDPRNGWEEEISALLRFASREEAIKQGWGDEWDIALDTGELWARSEKTSPRYRGNDCDNFRKDD